VGPYTSSLIAPEVGDTVYYLLIGNMSPVGTVNSQGGGTTITSLNGGTDGANAFKVDLWEPASAVPQVNFDALANFNTNPSISQSNDDWGALDASGRAIAFAPSCGVSDSCACAIGRLAIG
jgi:hypothetical protein